MQYIGPEYVDCFIGHGASKAETKMCTRTVIYFILFIYFPGYVKYHLRDITICNTFCIQASKKKKNKINVFIA